MFLPLLYERLKYKTPHRKSYVRLTIVSVGQRLGKLLDRVKSRNNVFIFGYFLAHFGCRLFWHSRVPSIKYLDTAGSEWVNKKLILRFLGCLARVPTEPLELNDSWKSCEQIGIVWPCLRSNKWCTDAASCGQKCLTCTVILLYADRSDRFYVDYVTKMSFLIGHDQYWQIIQHRDAIRHNWFSLFVCLFLNKIKYYLFFAVSVKVSACQYVMYWESESWHVSIYLYRYTQAFTHTSLALRYGSRIAVLRFSDV